MSSEGAGVSSFPTSRRAACDRCRKQKLRCPQRNNESQPCQRCARAGQQCTTGYSERLGRSSRDLIAASHHSDVESATILSDEPARGNLSSLGLTPLDTSSSPATAIGSGSSASWVMADIMSDEHLLEQGRLQTSLQDHTFNTLIRPYTDEQPLSDTLNTAPARPNSIENDSGAMFQDLGRLLSAAPPPRTISGQQTSRGNAVAENRRQTPASILEKILSGAECDLRLSQLSLDLSRQMQECMKMAPDRIAIDSSGNHASNTFEATKETHNGEIGYNAFGKALHSTSDFLNILQMYHYNHTGTTFAPISSSNPPHVNRVSSGRALNYACMLHLLSSYLRIIAIFDSLLSQVHFLQSCNGQSSPRRAEGIQILPDLRLAGFHVHHGALQTKILIEAIQHQFKLIEELLGLPVELRISDRQEAYHVGLLQNNMAKSLFQVVLNRQHGNEEQELMAFDCVSAVDSMESLKQSIAKVRQSLDS